jgi:hypothetical protein
MTHDLSSLRTATQVALALHLRDAHPRPRVPRLPPPRPDCPLCAVLHQAVALATAAKG